MKKTLLPVVAIVCIVVAIVCVHNCRNKPDTQGPTVTEVVTGDEVAFKLKYRGITGKADDLNSYGGYGFGSVKEADTPFGLWTVLVIHG